MIVFLDEQPITRGRRDDFKSDTEGGSESGDSEFEALRQPAPRARFVSTDMDLRQLSRSPSFLSSKIILPTSFLLFRWCYLEILQKKRRSWS